MKIFLVLYMMKIYSSIDMVVALNLGSTNNEKMINIQNSNFILNPFQTFLSGLNFTKCSQA